MNKIVSKQKLLDKRGHLAVKGYATKLLLEYSRKDIKACPLRIKEWDYYFMGNDKFGLSLTFADNSYMGLASAQFFDFEKGSKVTDFAFIPFPMGRMKMPTTSKTGDITFKNKKVDMRFLNDNGKRRLYCDMPYFDKSKGLKADIELYEEPQDSMVIATPFKDDKKAFYYNQKINCLKVRGELVYNKKEYDINSLMAVLDWGRGVWTYDNTWYWSSASAELENGESFGFNLGYGFGDTSAATENMLFYKGRAHKLEHVDFGIPKIGNRDSFMDRWHFTSSDNRLEMIFKPFYDNRTKLNALILAQDAHQVFGKFSGRAVLDDGKEIKFHDIVGFAEKVRNKW
ncbi:MAG: DUF2804 domain-containing protein [Bacillota bacterium]|jgi:hypothetical protein|nr:DUF2804 domain-containing protein [Bacillota bacterium]HHU43958.1 DUF2804 domain-containing protein [Clostridiales bacterium]